MAKDAGKISFDSDAFLANEGRGRTLCRFQAKEVIYSQGDLADAVYFIHQGNVKIIVTSRNGKEAVLALLSEDHFFGERCLRERSVRRRPAACRRR
jgi:CRP/FNR family cyclic AMP-dependent transcriptional regulator